MGRSLEITLLISELSDVERVREFYNRSTELVPIIKQRQEEARVKLQSIDDCGKDIPTVFQC